GAKVLLPTSFELIVFILALVIVYSIVKILSYGVFGTAIGLNVPSSVAIGAIVLPIGEFGILIASVAERLNPANCEAIGNCLVHDPSGLLSIAFALTILTTLIGPFIFKKVDAVSSLVLKLYPYKVRQRIALVGGEIQGLEELFVTNAFQNEVAILLKNLFSNLVIAVSVVYLSFILRKQITFTFLHFLPTELSLAVLLLPLIIWPLFNFAKTLKLLIKKFEGSIFSLAFKKTTGVSPTQSIAFDLVAGFVMTALGLVGTFLMYSSYPNIILAYLVPAVYTVLAVFHLSKAFYAFLEHYSNLEPRKRKASEQRFHVNGK
ncbi:MAG: hypothetical protein Q8R15_03855, partial [Candidatus Micrarchaeota archaeon]|nr:hypothetical protein [Candidatus Micrarchaeota archaeon]